MCDPVQLATLLEGLIVDDLASSIYNFMKNLELPNAFQANRHVHFKAFVNRLLCEIGFVPVFSSQEVEEAILRDFGGSSTISDTIEYNSTTYALQLAAIFPTDDVTRFRVILATDTRSLVLSIPEQDGNCLMPVTRQDRETFDTIIRNWNVKLLKFVNGMATGSGSLSRDEIPLESIALSDPDTVVPFPAYHMNLA